MLRFIKNHLHKGQQAEKIALNYLQAQGLKKIATNYTCKHGEIDLIMRDKEYLVFVEVRYRGNTAFGHPLETINFAKQQKLIKTSQYYLMKNPNYLKKPYRFDAISICSQKHLENNLSQKTKDSETIEWVKNAIQ